MGMVNNTKFYEGDRMFEAGEYDHIFDVELGDNIMRKLPFNNGANAIQAAEKFCVRENLGRANIEQIRQHITTHSLSYPTRDVGGASKPVQEEVDNTMRTLLNYDAVKIDGPKKKILEFNNELKLLDEKDLKVFDRLCEILNNKN